MIYLENKDFRPKDARNFLLKIREFEKNTYKNTIIRDVRISSKFIEIDVSVPDRQGLEDLLTKLEIFSPLIETIQVKDKEKNLRNEALEHAINMFNQEKYWWAHEALEHIWKESKDEEKILLNGIILVCAALVHYQKDEKDICISILKRAIEKLSKYNKIYYYKINIAKIKEFAENYISKPEKDIQKMLKI